MPFNPKNLSVVSYADGFTLWHYRTPDARVSDPGYFNDAAHLVKAGDVIMVNVDVDRRFETQQWAVELVDNGTVDIRIMTETVTPCADCGSPLNSQERKYYAVTCEACERRSQNALEHLAPNEDMLRGLHDIHCDEAVAAWNRRHSYADCLRKYGIAIGIEAAAAHLDIQLGPPIEERLATNDQANGRGGQ